MAQNVAVKSSEASFMLQRHQSSSNHIKISQNSLTAAMAEWLRRLTRNQMGFPRAGSNPARSDRVLNPRPLGCAPKCKIGANHCHYGVEPVKYAIENNILVQLTSFYSLYCVNFESFSCSFTPEAPEDALVKPLAVNLLHGWRDV